MLAKYKYKIIKDSGELGLDLDEGTFVIGDRVLNSFEDKASFKSIGAKKRFTHEWWHYIFANLSEEKQRDLVDDFQRNVLTNPELQGSLDQFCTRLYSDDAYGIHFPNGKNEDIFTENSFGIKVRDISVIPIKGKNTEVYSAFLLTEILSLSSESETPYIDNYYEKVEPEDQLEHSLWENKKELGKLARELVPCMQSRLIASEFKDKTSMGLELLSEISVEYQSAEDGERFREINTEESK